MYSDNSDKKKLQKVEFAGPYVKRQIIAYSEKEREQKQKRLIGTPDMETCTLAAIATVWFSWAQQKIWAQFTTEVSTYPIKDEWLANAIPNVDKITSSTYSAHIDEMPARVQAWFDECNRNIGEAFGAQWYNACRAEIPARYRVTRADGSPIFFSKDALTDSIAERAAKPAWNRWNQYDGDDDEPEDESEGYDVNATAGIVDEFGKLNESAVDAALAVEKFGEADTLAGEDNDSASGPDDDLDLSMTDEEMAEASGDDLEADIMATKARAEAKRPSNRAKAKERKAKKAAK
jgi:hypothetical protein